MKLWDAIVGWWKGTAWKQCDETIRLRPAVPVDDYCQRHRGHWGAHRTYCGRTWWK